MIWWWYYDDIMMIYGGHVLRYWWYPPMEATPIPWFDLATKIAQKVKPRMQSPDHSQTSFRSPFPLCDRTKRTTSNILKPCRTLRTPRRPFGGVVGDRLPNSNDVRIHVPHLSFDAVPWDLLLAHDVTIRWSLKSSSWTKLQIWILFFGDDLL